MDSIELKRGQNMTDIQQLTRMDMTEFGMVGEVILGPPSFRKKAEMRNALGNCTKTHMVDGTAVVDETSLGYVDIIMNLVYIRSAPFRTDLEGFLHYCDLMDEKEIGTAQKFYDKLCMMITPYKDGAKSPFVDSQVQETENSA